MAERLTLRVLKGCSEGEFRAGVEETVAHHGGHVFWNAAPQDADEDFRTSHNGVVHALYLPYLDGTDYSICLDVGRLLSVSWIEVRIQEGTLWDYSLYTGDKHLHNFSVLPEYWEEDEEWIAGQRGDPRILAETWGIDRSRIENYLRPWRFRLLEDEDMEIVSGGKAYDSDLHEYGDFWQMHDFIRALGAHDPTDIRQLGRQHRLKAPGAAA